MTGSMYEGLGYTPNGVQSAATKPVSGESIVTFLERMDAIGEHGTKKGYEAGCRGSHCPGKDAVGMSCSQASIRYAGDMGYRRRVDRGMTAEAIWAEDQAAHVVMPKVNVRDNRTRFAFDEPEITVEDSVAAYEADEDYAAEEAEESVPRELAPATFVKTPNSPALQLATQRKRRHPDGKGTRRSITEQERATMRKLHGEGMSTTKMSQQMGRAVSVLSRELIAMGLTANGHRFGTKWS